MENLDKENLNALSDEELEDVNGGGFFMTLEGRAVRGRTAMFGSTLEDRNLGGKKLRKGVETLEQTEKKGHNLKFL